MPTGSGQAAGPGAEEIRAAIARFLQACRRPALLEPGEELLPLTGDNHALELRAARLTFQAWDRTRNLVRRVTRIHEETGGRLELEIERFARKPGRLFLVDLARPAGYDFSRRGARLVSRERFRQFLRRQFPDWTLGELSAEADLQHSLSPAYPRALLTRGTTGWAALAAPPDADAGAALSFGLIWLDYLRRREKRRAVEGLALYLPSGHERTTSLRLPWLNSQAARFELFTYSEQGFAARLDPSDYGNLDTRLDACRAPLSPVHPALERLCAVPGVETVPRQDGSLSLRVRGMEFAQAGAGGLRFGLAQHVAAVHEQHFAEAERLARDLAERRAPGVADRAHPLYQQHPEAWLESSVRAHIEAIDAALLPAPVYGQVPAFAGGERGVIDLLAAERSGRLAVLELKAAADLHLPLQALDYWMRVQWHLARGEFEGRGYFPGLALRREPPRLFLVSPALEFHPSTEAILGYFSPSVDVVRVGVGVEWRKTLEVMFRLRGAEKPEPC